MVTLPKSWHVATAGWFVQKALSGCYLVYRTNQERENSSVKYIDLLDQKTAL